MRSIKAFLRAIPASHRREFVDRSFPELALEVDWEESTAVQVKYLGDRISAVPGIEQQVQSEVERICALADAVGEAAMRSVTLDQQLLEALPNNTSRSLFMFLHEFDRFRWAEDIRYTDEHRRGRSWSGYAGPRDCNVSIGKETLDRLATSLRQRFGWGRIHIEAFERRRIGESGEEYLLVQATIYREGWPDQVLEFEGEELKERSRRPVYEAAVTYEPNSGCVEVVAASQLIRKDIAQFFCTEVLGSAFEGATLPLREFDLKALKEPHSFPNDATDRIDSVRVSMLRLKPMDTEAQRLILETLSKSKETIWEMADRRLADANPLRGPWVVTQTKLIIHFRPEPGSREGRTLPILITMPHGCDLKDRTTQERLVGQKYLARWGLLKSVAA